MQIRKALSFIAKGIKRIRGIDNYFRKCLLINRNLELIQNIIEISPNPFFYKDKNNIYLYCNLAFAKYLGIKKEEIIGNIIVDISPKEIVDMILEADKELMNNENIQTYKTKVKGNNGLVYEVVLTKYITLDNEGIGVNMTDITELIMSEKVNKRTLNLNQAMLEINQIIIEKNDILEICNLVLDKVTTAIELADAGCVLLFDKNENLKIIASKGYDTEQCKRFSINLTDSFYYKKNNGKIDKTIIINDIQKFNWNEYTDFWKRSQAKVNKAVLINEENAVDWVKYSKILESSQAINIESSIATPIVFDNQLYGFINIDSTENNAFHESDIEVMNYIKYQIEVGISKYKIYEETIYLSRYDRLTKVCNRGYFEKLFDNSLKGTTKKSENFYFVMLDINGLKVINDTYGHLTGDELIKEFAFKLSVIIKDSDILGRLGGDEFAAIFFGIEFKTLKGKLENLNMDFVTNPLMFEKNIIKGSFSYGISEFPKDGIDYNELFKKADKKMYEYKKKAKSLI